MTALSDKVADASAKLLIAKEVIAATIDLAIGIIKINVTRT